MTKFKLFAGLAMFIFLTSCQHSTKDLAVITCDFSGAAGVKLILLEMDTHEIRHADSTTFDNSGKFTFSPTIKDAGFWLLKAPTGKVLVLLLNTGDQIELSGNFIDFPDHIRIKAPQDALRLTDFFYQTRTNERLVDSLEMLLVERQDSSDYYRLTQKLDTSFREIWENQRALEIAFINSHCGSLASLVVLNYAFGMSPVLNIEEDFSYYQALDSSLSISFPGNKHVTYHHQRVMDYQRKTLKND